eukprot:TRINITY_DN30761_c0_g1_i1.p1 TRINITY_DN30761_c0_g1~~TRINITY_DN30761_c0_g1_i1.p1  ORF type:complete len:406 (-),score=63.81 TRINITY_DN30761_c0_g1_i1:438-1655(-)
MAMFDRTPPKQDIYSTLTDPTEASQAETVPELSLKDNKDARRRVKQRCMTATLSLVASAVGALTLFSDASCDGGTSSGVPFNLVTEAPGRYFALVVLTILAHVAAVCYPVAVIRKPRPQFLHVAGCYLVLNASVLANMVTTIWAGCKSYEYMRLSTAAFCMGGFAASFVLLQYSILVKVEALNVDASEQTLSNAAVRRTFHWMLNPITIGIGMASAVVPLNVIKAGPAFDLVVTAQGIFLVAFSCVFLLFTACASMAMLKCRLLLNSAALTSEKKALLRHHLLVHCLATVAANMTAVLFFVSVALVVYDGRTDWAMLIVFALDNAFNMICALALSGLLGAVFRQHGGVALMEDETGLVHNSLSPEGPPGVVESFAAAGHAAQEAVDAQHAAVDELAPADKDIENE